MTVESEDQVCVHFRSLGVCAECAQAREGDQELVVDEPPPWKAQEPIRQWVEAMSETAMAKERRERIATAVLSGMAGNPSWYWALAAPERQQPGNYGRDYDSPERMAGRTAQYALVWADALIAELDK